MFTIVDQLPQANNLQILKVKFPCLYNPDDMNKMSSERYSRLLQDLLDPLKRLSVHRRLVFVAAHRVGKQNLLEGNGRTQHHQCQQPKCLAFVASLDYLKNFLTGMSPRVEITPQERIWLAIKPRISLICC